MSQMKDAGRKSSRSSSRRTQGFGRGDRTGAAEKLATDEVASRVIHYGVGGISESDVSSSPPLPAPSFSASMSAPMPRRVTPPSAPASRSATTTSSTTSWTTLRRCRAPCWRRPCARPSSAMPRSSRSSTSPRSARSPAAASPKAWSSAARQGQADCDNVVVHEGTLSTLKRFKGRGSARWSPVRGGMAFESYQGHAGRRCHRVLPRRRGETDAVSGRTPSQRYQGSAS